MKVKLILLRSVAFVLIAIIGYSGYQLWGINQMHAQEAQIHSRLLHYKPVPLGSGPSISPASSPYIAEPKLKPKPVLNQSILDLQAEYNDVVGWLTIPGTQIDYPFAQSNDNDYYLHMDLDQNRSAAGTIFMDYRNSKDFSYFNTIIFGHNMRNGSMFGTLQDFNDRDFFDNNKTGTIFLADRIYEIEFMAFAVIKPDDPVIFNTDIVRDIDKIAFLDYVKNAARHHRDIDIGVASRDRVITLSTCNYEFDNARMVIIGRILQ